MFGECAHSVAGALDENECISGNAELLEQIAFRGKKWLTVRDSSRVSSLAVLWRSDFAREVGCMIGPLHGRKRVVED